MSRLLNISFVVVSVFVGLLFNDNLELCVTKLKNWYYGFSLDTEEKVIRPKGLFSADELSQYNGEIRPQLYLAFMGIVFDVSLGRKYYGKGSSYHYFVGKDGTRAFVTGDFNDDSKNKDHVLDFTCQELLGLLNWQEVIKDKYQEVGFLAGRYYDNQGKESKYHEQMKIRKEYCIMEKEKAKAEDHKYPPCNIAWNAEEGTRVSCTKLSGGIKRGWTGVPRQLYAPGTENVRCVCVNDTTVSPNVIFKEYDNCPKTSTTCKVKEEN